MDAGVEASSARSAAIFFLCARHVCVHGKKRVGDDAGRDVLEETN